MSHIKIKPQGSPVQTKNPSELWDPNALAYSHTSIVPAGTKLIYIAGTVGFDKNLNFAEDFDTQARQAIANIQTCLKEHGATVHNLVSMTTYIVDYDEKKTPIFELFKELLRSEKGPYFPPAAVIPVPALVVPGLKIEIQAVAAVSELSSLIDAAQPGRVLGDTADVIIVGAGLSGLTAARDVQAAGLSCIVLEAKDRVGGKTRSINLDHGGTLDLGAAWINDRTQPKMYELYRKCGFEPIVQYFEGDELYRDQEKVFRTKVPCLPPMSTKHIDAFNKIAEDMDRDAATINIHDPSANTHLEDTSLEEYFREKGADGNALAFWTAWIRALTGTEPSKIGLVYWLDYVKSCGGVQSLISDGPDGAQYMTNRSGNQNISVTLAANLKPGSVRLNSAVKKITQTSDGAYVETISGQLFHCRKVLISCPTPLYRHINFSPPLPADKQEYVDSVHLGPYSKCILVYSSPWWRELGLSGSFIDLKGPVTFSRDVSSPQDGMYAISNLIFGDYAAQWMTLPGAQRIKKVKDVMAEMVGEEHGCKVYETIQEIEQHWAKEPYIEGVPCPMPAPGGIWPRLGNALRRPFQNLHFIGTETAYEWKGYMEGAVRAGERGAAEVVDLLMSKGSAVV